jgi:valyl-tRNA synthetase
MEYPRPITSIDDLPKAYAGLARERFWQNYWRASGVYTYLPVHSDGTLRRREEIYSVDTPPPTVSGALHIGHVYSYTQTDFSVRYQRMKGKHVYYPFGFDDNGLPSERLVERVTGKRAHEVGREEFIKLCRPILEDAEQQFKDLWQSLALSCDWHEYYTTIEPRSRAISQASFIDLYNKGYVYRKVAPTQWCVVDQTAIAQAEIFDREVQGHFHDIVFKWADGPNQPVRGELIISTTRPELIPACVAVFCNPTDARPLPGADGMRVCDLQGKVAITPLFEVEVPILHSDKADPEKGTGILMCCTFGDMEDVEHWKREWPEQWVPTGKLPTRVIIEKDGQIQIDLSKFVSSLFFQQAVSDKTAFDVHKLLGGNPNNVMWPSADDVKAKGVAARLNGLKIDAARKQIRQELDSAELLRNVREITHAVRHSERGGAEIQFLVTPQWYIRILDHKQELIEQGRKVRWHPEYMFKRFEHWVEGLNQDWCISRQRYNGVPFPMWYTPFNQTAILADISALPVNPLVDNPNPHGPAFSEAVSSILNDPRLLDILQEREMSFLRIIAEDIDAGRDPRQTQALIPERDVMDTWATSSLTPLLNTHLIIGQNDPAVAARHAQVFPYDLRPQAHDIIRTWAFYTITKAFFHFGEIPWKDIVISGHAQDVGGKKISKSKGHVVTPAEMVQKYTADGLRYWSSSCKLGTDTLYDERLLGEGKRLITKLFNASKFALKHLLDFDPGSTAVPGRDSSGGAAVPGRDSSVAREALPANAAGEDTGRDARAPVQALLSLVTYPTDRWILSQLGKAIARATRAHEDYEFGDAKQAAEDFFWADFCDNYLELSKGRLYGEPLALEAHPGLDADALRLSAQTALYIALSSVLKLFAPAMPHITEECWSWYFQQWTGRRGIHDEPWPQLDVPAEWEADAKLGQSVVDVLAAVRKWKSEHSVSIKKPLRRMTVYVSEEGRPVLAARAFVPALGDLLSTCNAEKCSLAAVPAPDGAATTSGNAFAVACELEEE